MQTGSSWKITFATQTKYPMDLTDFLEEYFEVTSCDYDEDENECLSAYSSTPIDEEALKKAAHLANVQLPSFECEFIPAANWLTKTVIKFDPIETDDFLIFGSHEEQAPSTTKIPVRIYAATAFGSGQHQTTNSCLQLISSLKNKHFVPRTILDMGCGSGILAIAANKLWREAKVVAADIDEEAAIVAMQNAADNGVDIIAFQNDGYDGKKVCQHGPYSLIVSNILARPLIEMAEALSNNLETKGYAILSGFIEDQVDWVVSEHEKFGLKLVEVYKIDHWRAVVMEKVA